MPLPPWIKRASHSVTAAREIISCPGFYLKKKKGKDNHTSATNVELTRDTINKDTAIQEIQLTTNALWKLHCKHMDSTVSWYIRPPLVIQIARLDFLNYQRFHLLQDDEPLHQLCSPQCLIQAWVLRVRSPGVLTSWVPSIRRVTSTSRGTID